MSSALMAKQRYKRIQAGRLVREVLWTPVFPGDTPRQRAEKSRMTTAARKRVNLRCAWEKLKLILAANFDLCHIHVILTYAPECLPPNREAARRMVRKSIVKLREAVRRRGGELRYVYNNEGLHSGGRIHHHLVVNLGQADLELIQEIWPYGMVRWGGTIDEYGYAALAQYLTKEARDEGLPNGARSWVPSKNLNKPEESPAEWVPNNVRLAPPTNAHVLEKDEKINEFGQYCYIEYLLPEPPKQWRTRPKRPARTKTEIGTRGSGDAPAGA